MVTKKGEVGNGQAMLRANTERLAGSCELLQGCTITRNYIVDISMKGYE